MWRPPTVMLLILLYHTRVYNTFIIDLKLKFDALVLSIIVWYMGYNIIFRIWMGWISRYEIQYYSPRLLFFIWNGMKIWAVSKSYWGCKIFFNTHSMIFSLNVFANNFQKSSYFSSPSLKEHPIFFFLIFFIILIKLFYNSI